LINTPIARVCFSLFTFVHLGGIIKRGKEYFYMDIEEREWIQPELDLLGEHTVIPNHWESVTDKVIAEEDTTEVSSAYRKPKFQEDFLEGFV
jgi:hypothetical protein